jgi:hypothetical protein
VFFLPKAFAKNKRTQPKMAINTIIKMTPPRGMTLSLSDDSEW